MPFYSNQSLNIGDIEDDSRRAFLDAVESYRSNDTAGTALSMANVLKKLHHYYERPSNLLGEATHPRDSIYFACLDLLGRALRKSWCLDEAQLVFSFGIKMALICPGAYMWAHEYYSRWVSTKDRQQMPKLELPKAGLLGILGLKSKVKVFKGEGETSPPKKVLESIKNILTELGAVQPYEDELLMELNEYTKQDFFPDFKKLSENIEVWGWNDEPFGGKNKKGRKMPS